MDKPINAAIIIKNSILSDTKSQAYLPFLLRLFFLLPVELFLPCAEVFAPEEAPVVFVASEAFVFLPTLAELLPAEVLLAVEAVFDAEVPLVAEAVLEADDSLRVLPEVEPEEEAFVTFFSATASDELTAFEVDFLFSVFSDFAFCLALTLSKLSMVKASFLYTQCHIANEICMIYKDIPPHLHYQYNTQIIK